MTDDTEFRLRTLETGLVALQTTLKLFMEDSRRLTERIEAVLVGRSGETERDQTARRDIDSAHEKIRAIDLTVSAQNLALNQRADRAEARLNRLYWFALGGIAVLKFLGKVVPDNWLQILAP
ncbi:MAG TPA: hypothetical protein VGS22_16455 [Thermoanaerobaculia bacterium]|nr:hypothetical protein [Thermoanaerobaculia bacterium]